MRFRRDAERLKARYRDWHQAGWEERFQHVLGKIRQDGPCRTDAFEDKGQKTGRGWWDWQPSKTALEFLWRSGQLAVCRREGFRKVYALADEVYPPGVAPDDTENARLADVQRAGPTGFREFR